MPILTVDEFDNINTNTKEYYLNYFSDLVNEELEYIFNPQVIIEADKFNYGTNNTNGTSLVSIGAWFEPGTVYQINVTNGGSGYTTATVSFGSGNAQAEAVITSGSISAINITNTGRNYTLAPTVTITGDGTDAEATALISTLEIKKIDLDNSHIDNPTGDNMSLGQDYVYFYAYNNRLAPNRENPIVGIKLLNEKLHKDELLRVSGVYGWSPFYPFEIKNLVANLTQEAINFNQEKQDGVVSNINSKNSLTRSISYGTEGYNLARGIWFNALQDPKTKNILDKYKLQINNNITVL